jgi:hypothetical protein
MVVDAETEHFDLIEPARVQRHLDVLVTVLRG